MSAWTGSVGSAAWSTEGNSSIGVPKSCDRKLSEVAGKANKAGSTSGRVNGAGAAVSMAVILDCLVNEAGSGKAS